MNNGSSSTHRYSAYKDSGIERLGEVPEHWELERLKFVAEIRGGIAKGRNLSGKTTIKLPYLRVANVQDGYLRLDEISSIEIEPHEEVKYSLKPGDILMTEGGDNDKLGRGSVWQGEISKCLHQNHVFAVRPFDATNSHWINWVKQTDYLKYFFLSRSKQTTNLASISSANLKETPIILPPLHERLIIAHYLDTKTAQIDRKIDLLTQKAAQYGNLKQSLINETVTRGLDKSVPMKDSEIEWLGEVPEHREVIRLKDVAAQSKEKNGTNPVGKMLSVSGYRGIEIKQYDDELKKRTDDELSDYRVVRVGQLVVNTMWLNYRGIGVSKYRGYVSPAYRAYFVNKSIHGAFIHYLMRSDLYVCGYSKYLQGIRPNSLQMKTIDFECLPLPIPPLSEQKAIADYLDTKTAQIDHIIRTLNTQIEKLKELRKTLINDVVTGKIRVIEDDPSSPHS
jgi:type I restriction enzyme, S subunit